MKPNLRPIETEMNIARRIWGEVGTAKLAELRALVRRNRISIALGDVCYIENRWYITHSGLLRLAHRKRCIGIKTDLERGVSDPVVNRWVFKATVYKTSRSKGFVGYGDADPSNTSPLVRGAEMRVAETRAVNRALRKAYGIPVCSVEELGSFSAPQRPLAGRPHSNGHHGSHGSNNGRPRLRDRLCLLIRQYNLDPTLVKAYAADFCGTATLKEASRDLVESFISELSTAAKNDRDSLLCKLNSYAQPTEVKA
jgi:hypothetical protein